MCYLLQIIYLAISSLFFVDFRSFQARKNQSSIRHRDSNQQLLNLESPPLTTSPYPLTFNHYNNPSYSYFYTSTHSTETGHFGRTYLPIMISLILIFTVQRRINCQRCQTMGCRHSSVDSSAPSILLPRVQVLSTPSTLLSIYIDLCHVERRK